MRRQAEEALTTVLSVADRADAFRSVPFLQHPDGKRGVLGGVGLETANAVSASSTVKVSFYFTVKVKINKWHGRNSLLCCSLILVRPRNGPWTCMLDSTVCD